MCIVYSREQLTALQNAALFAWDRHEIPAEVFRKTHQGLSAARKLREKRRFRPILPTVPMGNVKSLPKKMDKLVALTRH